MSIRLVGLEVEGHQYPKGVPESMNTLAKAFESVKNDFAVPYWKKTGNVMSTCLAISLTDATIYMIKLPWGDEHEKEGMVNMTRSFLASKSIDFYVFFSEVWLRKGNSDGTLAEHVDVKQDGLMVLGVSIDGSILHWNGIRTSDGEGGWVYSEQESRPDSFRGRMTEFLIPLPEGEGGGVILEVPQDGSLQDTKAEAIKAAVKHVIDRIAKDAAKASDTQRGAGDID